MIDDGLRAILNRSSFYIKMLSVRGISEIILQNRGRASYD